MGVSILQKKKTEAEAIANAPSENTLMQPKQLKIPGTKTAELSVTLEGTTPLIMHRFGAKAQKDIADKQAKVAKKAKEARDPNAEYLDSIYRDDDGNVVLPVVNFKAAMLRTWELVGMKNKNAIRFGIILPGEFVPLEGDHKMRQDYVRLANVSSIAYRAEFTQWKVQLVVRINLNVLSIEQVLNIITEAGQACGVGDWRPEKSSGTFGCWQITDVWQTDGPEN